MAKELGMEPFAYETEYNAFLAKLKKFHDSKGTPFRRLPWLGGQFLDLFLLYKKVTYYGGWIKVTEDKKWRDIAEVFNLPSTCTNAAFALRQHYSRFLESYERINFFGEDAEDVLVPGRPNTPIGITPYSGPSEYTTSVTARDDARNFEKLVLSLQCGLPNEVDFGINICMLLSNVSNSVFNLTKAPAVIDMLLAHVGVFGEAMHSLNDVYKEWYQKTDRDFIKFWRETLEVEDFREIFCGIKGEVEAVDERLFNPGKKYGISSVEAQRVAQVCMILYNFSFDATNAEILASHSICLRFLMMCICSRLGFIQSLAWNTLSNLCEKTKLDPVESQNTQIFFQILHYFLNDKDRFRVIKAMDILGKLCTREDNDEVMESALEMQGYQSLIKILIIPDVQLVIGSLEALYNISGVGQVTSNQIACTEHGVDILVCMVTLDVDFFGSQALSEVQIIENRIPTSIPPRPRPVHTPQASSPSPTPPQSPAASRNEVDAETFTYKWLQATYEVLTIGTVSRIDLYADYLSSCSRLARIGILNATSFNRVVKMVFPDAQLRRFPSGSQLQYALVGVRKRANPLSMQSQTEQHQAVASRPQGSPTPQTMQQQTRGIPGGQGGSYQQEGSRTPTPPTPGQSSPTWNQAMQQRSVQQVQTSPSSPTGQFQRGAFNQAVANQRVPVQVLNQVLVRRPSLPGQQTVAQIQGANMAQMQQQQAVSQASTNTAQVHRIPGQFPPQAQGGTIRPSFPAQSQVPIQPNTLMPQLQKVVSVPANSMTRQMINTNQQNLQLQQMQQMPQNMQSVGTQGMKYQLQAPQLQRARLTSPLMQHVTPLQPQLATPPPLQRPLGEQTPPPQTPTPSLMPPHSPQGVSSPGLTALSPSLQAIRSQAPSHNPMQQVQQQPNAQALPGMSPNNARIAPMPGMFPQPRPAQVPISPVPPAPIQSPAPSTSLPGPGHNDRPHPGTLPVGPQTPHQLKLQKPMQPGQQVQQPTQGAEVQRYMPSVQGGTTVPPGMQNHFQGFPPNPQGPRVEGAARGPPPQSPHGWPRTPQPRATPPAHPANLPFQRDVPSGFPGRNFTQQAIAPKPLPGQRPSLATAVVTTPADGVVLIAREERAEDVVSTAFLKNSEEQRIIVVENTNRNKMQSQEKVNSAVENSNSEGSNGNSYSHHQSSVSNSMHFGNDTTGRTGSFPADLLSNPNKSIHQGTGTPVLKRDAKTMELPTHPNLNSESVLTNNKVDHNGHDTPKRPRLEGGAPNDTTNSPTLPTDVPTSLVNGGIRTDPRNKLMDKLFGKDPHMPLNGVCDINTAELDLMAAEGERLSSSNNSKSSSPDIFGSENNSDFGKYFEESDTDTGLFSDVLSGDLRIDPVETDSKGKIDEQQKVPSLPDLGYHAVAQELRNQASLPVRTPTNEGSVVFNKNTSVGTNMQVKIPIPSMSSIRTAPQQTLPQQAPHRQPGPNEMVLSRYGSQQPNLPSRAQIPAGLNHEGGSSASWNGPARPNAPPNFQGNVPPPAVPGPNIQQSPSAILEHRTRALVTPRASVMETQEVQNRQNPAAQPPQPPKNVPSLGVSGNRAMGPPGVSGPTSPATPPTVDGSGQYYRTAVGAPTVESFKPYRCRWESCTSSFDDSKQVFAHVVGTHVPRDTLVMSCIWENCPPVRRSRSSLLFHLQQKHCEPTPVPSSPHPPQPQAPQQPTPPTPQAHNPTSFPAYHLLARMLHALQDEEESPLTKTIRLTAALVLRNIAQYSATARSLLRRHERHLSEVAMSGSEAAVAVASCLSELSPHRKTSQSDSDNFIWALEG